MTDAADILDRAADAALAIAAEGGWKDASLRDVAARAEVPFAALYAMASGRPALLARISARLDQAALAAAEGEGEDVHDRLFDAAMARVEAMEPHREALIALSEGRGRLIFALTAPRTARAILEAAGVDATPPRLAAMTATWLRIVQVWRDDEGALNRTMAEIDKRLKSMRERLGHIRAGF